MVIPAEFADCIGGAVDGGRPSFVAAGRSGAVVLAAVTWTRW